MTNEIIKQSPFEISTFAEAERFAKMIADSDFAPKDYKGKPGNVLIAMQMGHELGLKPMQAIQNIAVVNGRPMVWGDAALALVRGNPECGYVREGMEGTIKDGDANAYCEVKRGNEIIRREFSVKQAAQASLIGKAGTWTQYPERMLQLRARGFALRDSFPDVLKGIYIEGEIVEEPEQTIEHKEPPKLGVQAVKHAVTQMIVSQPIIEKEIINPETGEVTSMPNSAAPSFEDIKKQMENATTDDDLILARDVARSLNFPKEKIDELAKIYKQKQANMKT